MSFSYVGSELDVFAYALNWKRYVARRLRPYLTRDVLEVGAGLGSFTRVLNQNHKGRWVCLEPDTELSSRARRELADTNPSCEYVVGTLENLSSQEVFDAILYMDVLEHIQDDGVELARAVQHLRPSGVVCVLAPAHQWLYTEFDKAIGHFRRYDKGSLRRLAPEGADLETLQYLDCCGLLPSAANRFFLKAANPTKSQILFWDRILVPMSRLVDPLVMHLAGKSVLAVWRKR